MEVAPGLISELDLETVLQRVLTLACELTGASYAALGVLDESRHELERFLTRGIDADGRERIGDLPRGRGVLGVLIEHPQPLRLGDVGEHPASYGFPPGHPPMSSFLGVPILIRGEAWGNLYLTEKQDGEFTDGDEQTAVLLAIWAAIAIENARLYERERRRAGELERAVRGMEATTDIARAIGGETELARVLELIVKRGRALVDARALAIALVDGPRLRVDAAAGEYRRELLGETVDLDGTIAEQVLQTKRSQRLSDLSSQLRFALGRVVDASTGLIVPLLFRGRGLGVLYAFDRGASAEEFNKDDERLLEAFAASAATAVATAQEFAAHGLRRSIEASERERHRWARELHDQTLQDLGALRLSLSTARRRGDSEALALAVDQAIADVADGIEELRAIITDLRPAALDELGTGAALEGLIERVAAGHGSPAIIAHIDLAYEQRREATRHTPALESALYRLVQEAITNAIKHGAAGTIEISVVENAGAIDVRVTDDGSGFDPQGVEAGFGLIGMRERVALVDGTLDVTSQPGGGATVHAVIPAVRRPHQHPAAATA